MTQHEPRNAPRNPGQQLANFWDESFRHHFRDIDLKSDNPVLHCAILQGRDFATEEVRSAASRLPAAELITSVQSPRIEIVYFSVAELVKRGDPDFIAPLMERLNGNSTVARLTLPLLGKLGAKADAAVPHLCEMLSHERMGYDALKALFDIGSDLAINTILEEKREGRILEKDLLDPLVKAIGVSSNQDKRQTLQKYLPQFAKEFSYHGTQMTLAIGYTLHSFETGKTKESLPEVLSKHDSDAWNLLSQERTGESRLGRDPKILGDYLLLHASFGIKPDEKAPPWVREIFSQMQGATEAAVSLASIGSIIKSILSKKV